MKKFILFILFIVISHIGFSQEYSLIENEKDSITITVANKQFIGGETKSGKLYIYRISAKTGKRYRSYLGTQSEDKFNGQPIYVDANTKNSEKKYWIYGIGNNGFPRRKYLRKS